MNNAVQQALDYLKKIKAPVDNILQVGNQIQNAVEGTVNSFANKTDKPVGIPLRRQQNSVPVANLKNGKILYSDGTVKEGLASMKLNALRQNVLDQYNFTPQAAEYAKGIDLGYDINAKPSAGRIIAGEYQKINGKPTIDINAKILDQQTIGVRGPAQTMAHELLHSMDANVNQDAMQSFQATGENSGDSYGFYDKFIKSGPEGVKKDLDSFLSGYPKNPDVQDVESFAQFGSKRGEKVMQSPAEKFYNNIFVRGSKDINYSPMFPVKDPYKNISSIMDDESKF